MPFVESNRFSASDLDLFVDSLEEISRLENLKQQRKQILRAQANLKQHADNENSSTLITTNNNPEGASAAETFEENHLVCSSDLLMENEYDVVNDAVDNIVEDDDVLLSESTRYNVPYDHLTSTTLDDDDDANTINRSDHQYEELQQTMKKPKAKRKLPLLDFVCKKYKKCFPSNNANTEDWIKSDSWTQIDLV